MLNWLKAQVKNRLKFFFKHELNELITSELQTEFKYIYRQLRWEEFIQTKSALFIPYALNNKVYINLYKGHHLSHPIYFDQFEKEVVDFLNANISTGSCFIDIGANIGFFTLLTSNLVAESGMVLAFEPTPETYKRLTENIELNNFANVYPNNVAVSDYEGVAKFNISLDGNDVFNSFSTPTHGESYTEKEVDVKCLDSFYEKIKSYKDKIFIKIDVEGWEYNVIKGAEKILTTLNPVLIIEFNDENTQYAPHKCKDLYSLLKTYSYELFIINNGNLIAKENEEYFSYQNLIAKKE
jgi:FkbM family methyltransferase